MIKRSALQPRLAEIGKIKTGGKGEKREKKGKKGEFYQLPTRFGHFVVTTTERDQTGNFKPDPVVMESLPPKPRELSIRLLFDDIAMNLQTEFAMYMGKKKLCSGNGESAQRLKKIGQKLSDELETIDCPNWNCEFMKSEKCKVSARLFCAVPQSMELGGVHIFRTHSSNSAAAMHGALLFFQENTNGILQGLPLKLKLVKKQTEEHGEVDFVTIVLDGMEMMQMRQTAALELTNRKLLGVDMKRIEHDAKESGWLIDNDKPEDVEDEFYTKDAEEKPAATGQSAADVAGKIKNANTPAETKAGSAEKKSDSPI